ncbi:hypothetical protein [Dactylosporangium sp. CA-233914]|uniref:hypothetical protein n=1 Tax=Dactylosporangium sp. CA-233914 TaxID=3239934 RepID=UPI003D8AFE89
MLTMLWNLSAAIRGYLRFYMPTNRAIDWLRSPRGLKWAIPVALVAVPAYLFLMSVCAVLAQRPSLGWLNVLVVLFFWNAMKFAVMAPTSLVIGARSWISRRRHASRGRFVPMGYEPGRGAAAWRTHP